MRYESTRLAITYALLAAFSYAVLAYLIQVTEHHLPNAVLIFFRQAIALMILLPIIPFKLGSFKALRTKEFPLHMLRTFASLSSMFCLYFALRHLSLTDAVLLTYTRPLFIPLVVYLWFRKKWTTNTWVGLLVGFLGVILILDPSKEIFHVASLVGLGAGMFGAVAFTILRRLTKTEPPERTIFYYMALSIPLAALPMAGSWQTPTPHAWGLLVVIAVVAIIYQMFLSRAYRHAKAVKVGSLLYSSVAFAYLFEFFSGNRSLPLTALVGMVLIVVGSIVALRDQKQE
ncbi:MAG: Riboflavin transporter [Chlamydiae bacterium]|nr:Riboflavin transporter [Chlamydiota bacterium]